MFEEEEMCLEDVVFSTVHVFAFMDDLLVPAIYFNRLRDKTWHSQHDLSIQNIVRSNSRIVRLGSWIGLVGC